MKRRAVAAVMMSIALLSACGEDDPVEDAAEDTSEAAEDATGSTESEAPADEGGGGAGGTVLIGTVGTSDDPDAFEIALTTEDGEPVESIPAGDYTIEVDDPSAIHNFHLTGGSVDETTSVPEKEQATFNVTFEPGEYTYVCDPHPPMTGSFTVT